MATAFPQESDHSYRYQTLRMDSLRSFEDSDLLPLESNHDIEMLRMGPYPWPLKQRIAGKHGHLSMTLPVSHHICRARHRKFLSAPQQGKQLPGRYQTVRSVLCESASMRIRTSHDVALRDRAGSSRSGVPGMDGIQGGYFPGRTVPGMESSKGRTVPGRIFSRDGRFQGRTGSREDLQGQTVPRDGQDAGMDTGNMPTDMWK